jgi:hypothetical protein
LQWPLSQLFPAARAGHKRPVLSLSFFDVYEKFENPLLTTVCHVVCCAIYQVEFPAQPISLRRSTVPSLLPLQQGFPDYLTIKSVVDPGYDRPDDKNGDAAVVESAEEAAHVGRVAGDGVEQGGAGKAEDGADEEEQEDELIANANVVPAVVAERLQVEDDRGDEERDEANEVRPGDDVVKLFFLCRRRKNMLV